MTEAAGHNLTNYHRHSTRMVGYDYSLAGAYFVTTVALKRECIFGDLIDGELMLNVFGQIVTQSWEWLSQQYPYVELDSFIVMPNHFHGILRINALDVESRGGSRPTSTKNKPLGLQNLDKRYRSSILSHNSTLGYKLS
jgi:hypothetical protein